MAKREIPKLQVQPRERLGGRYSARLRKSGRLPAVVYGHKKDPVHVSVGEGEIISLLHRNQRLMEVVMDSQTEPCLVKDVQWNHLGSQIIHVDFARVDLNERVTVEVRLQLFGEAEGLKEGGNILEQPLSELEVECLVTEIPEVIRVDVSKLKKDEVLTVGQITLPEGVTTTEDAETIIASIHEVKEEVEETVAVEGATSDEPQVIGRKVEEGEVAAGADAAKPAAAPKSEKK